MVLRVQLAQPLARDVRVDRRRRDVGVAQQQLADSEEAVGLATTRLAAAHRTREAADGALAASAGEMYMQGGDLQNLTTLLFSPPGVVSGLAVVINRTADETRANLVVDIAYGFLDPRTRDVRT